MAPGAPGSLCLAPRPLEPAVVRQHANLPLSVVYPHTAARVCPRPAPTTGTLFRVWRTPMPGLHVQILTPDNFPVARLFRYASFGEPELLEGIVRQVSVRVVQESFMFAIPGAALISILKMFQCKCRAA
jgi:hypothetical protein